MITEVDLAIQPAYPLRVHRATRSLDEALSDGYLDGHRIAEFVVYPYADKVVSAVGGPGRRGGGADPRGAGGRRSHEGAHHRDRCRRHARPDHAAAGVPTLNRAATWAVHDASVTDLGYRALAVRAPVRFEQTEWALPRAALASGVRALLAAIRSRELEVGAANHRCGWARRRRGWLHPAFQRPTGWVAVRAVGGGDPRPLLRMAADVLAALRRATALGRPARLDATPTSPSTTRGCRTSSGSATRTTRTGCSATGTSTACSAHSSNSKPPGNLPGQRMRAATARTACLRLGAIHPGRLPLGEHLLACHPHVPHQAGPAGPHEVRQQLGVVLGGREGRVVEIHVDQVGPASLFEGSEVGAADRGRAVAGGHQQELGRGERGGVPAADAGEQAGEPGLGPQVEVVPGRGAVGAEADAHPGAPQRGHAGDAGGELGVGARAVRDGDAAVGKQRDVGVGELHAMCGEDPPAERADVVEQGGHRPVRRPLRPVLVGRLGHVDVQQRVPGAGVLGHGRQSLGGSVYAACGP